MTRDEAYAAMQEGHKVAHYYFDDHEYLYIKDYRIYAEDGVEFNQGWHMRKGESWEDNWRIVP